jgi:hypothetical protein
MLKSSPLYPSVRDAACLFCAPVPANRSFALGYALTAVGGQMTLFAVFPTAFEIPEFQTLVFATNSCFFDGSCVVFQVQSWATLTMGVVLVFPPPQNRTSRRQCPLPPFFSDPLLPWYVQVFASLHDGLGVSRQRLFTTYALASLPCYALNAYLWRYSGGNDAAALDPRGPSTSVEVSVVPTKRPSPSPRGKVAGSPKWRPPVKLGSPNGSPNGYAAVDSSDAGGRGRHSDRHSSSSHGGVSRAASGRASSAGAVAGSPSFPTEPERSFLVRVESQQPQSPQDAWEGGWVPLHERGLVAQLRSWEFAFVLLFAAVGILRANLYIGSNEQLLMNLGGGREGGRVGGGKHAWSGLGWLPRAGMRSHKGRGGTAAIVLQF